ncbi:MAG: tetratricopeptide repeat protein [Bacteroidales bacterium]|nr:MAG: tetratricopeptide repeat protein [Bacteroidales bacterium]
MEHRIKERFVPVLFIIVHMGLAQENNLHKGFSGDYLGQKPPGMMPTPFMPSLFSPSGQRNFHLHSSLFFTPDGNEVYFSNQDTSKNSNYKCTIYHIEQTDGNWGEPEIAPFSGKYDDNIVKISGDGNRIYFSSNRPENGENPGRERRYWMVERTCSGWNTPRHLTSTSDIPLDEGTFYFSNINPDGQNNYDIYLSRFENGKYSDPVPLNVPVNTHMEEYAIFSTSDEKSLVFYRTCEGDRSKTGLYISSQLPDGKWSDPRSFGDNINPSGFSASLSPDGAYLFILKRNEGIYWVNSGFLEYLTKNDLDIINLLYEEGLNKGISCVETLFKSLVFRHQDCFEFSGELLHGVSGRLLMIDSIDLAMKIIELNKSLCPDYLHGRDQILLASFGPDPGALKKLCKSIRKMKDLYILDEHEINSTGYLLLSKKLIDKAILIFKLNVQLFPDSWNVYDSLGEAYLGSGKLRMAKKYYQHSLCLNGNNTSAKKALSEINKPEQ